MIEDKYNQVCQLINIGLIGESQIQHFFDCPHMAGRSSGHCVILRLP